MITNLSDKKHPVWIADDTVKLSYTDCDVWHCPNTSWIEWWETDADVVNEVSRFEYRPPSGFFKGAYEVTSHYTGIGYAVKFRRHKNEKVCQVMSAILFDESKIEDLREHLRWSREEQWKR